MHISPALMFIAIAVVIAVVIINLFKYMLRKRIIDLGTIDAAVVKALFQPASFLSDALKWGILLVFGGTGLVLLYFLPTYDLESPLPYGIEGIFLGAGFLTYYFLERKTS